MSKNIDQMSGQRTMFSPTPASWPAGRLAVFVFAMLYLLPLAILGDRIYVEIHDNLDCDFLYLHLLSKSGQAFTFQPNAVIESVMNGLPRSLLRSGLNVTVLLFSLFDSFTAMVINDVLVHAIAFAGMYLLLTRYIIIDPGQRNIAIALSLSFAFVKFYSTGNGISTAGQPLLLFAFLNVLNRRTRFTDYIVIILFPLYSFFVMAGPFIIAALLVIFLADYIRNKNMNYRFLLWVFILCFLYIAVEYQMFKAIFFDPSMVVHRAEWDTVFFPSIDLSVILSATLKNLLTTQYHAGFFYTGGTIISILLAFILSRREAVKQPYFIAIMSAVLAIALFCGFYPFLLFHAVKIIPILKIYQWDRIYFLLPLCWFVLLGYSLLIISRTRSRFSGALISALVCLQLLLVIAGNRVSLGNVYAAAGNVLSRQAVLPAVSLPRLTNAPNFRQYFSVALFSRIRDHINRDQRSYRVVSVGLEPGIAQYNGFLTLDSYQNSYPLKYKQSFTAIISPELAKDGELSRYFYSWGNRCYVFSSELWNGCLFMCGKSETVRINNLNIDTAELKKLGGEYILSAVEITNYDKLNLHFERSFSDEDSFWRIFLYKVG